MLVLVGHSILYPILQIVLMRILTTSFYLHFTAKNREIRLGDYESLLKDKECYDVAVAPKTDHLLVARKGGLDVWDLKTERLAKSLNFEHKCFAVQSHENLAVIAVENANQTRISMITLDLDDDYNKVGTWTSNYSASDFTIVDSKIYLVTGNYRQLAKGIKVFTLEGKEQRSLSWNGSLVGIAHAPPEFVVFGDDSQHVICKRRVTSGEADFEWKVDMKAPHCICVDKNGLIWIRSNTNDCFTILNEDGG